MDNAFSEGWNAAIEATTTIDPNSPGLVGFKDRVLVASVLQDMQSDTFEDGWDAAVTVMQAAVERAQLVVG